MFKIGDKVLFSLAGENQPIIKSNFGVILNISDNKCTVVRLGSGFTSVYQNVNINKIEHLDNKSIVDDEILNHYNKKIDEYRLKLKEVTQEMKDDERVKKYEFLKNQIKTTAKNLCESQDDFDFENKLKAICRLKKELYTIELDCISEIRKYNGNIYYEIRQVENVRDNALKGISDHTINKTLEKL